MVSLRVGDVEGVCPEATQRALQSSCPSRSVEFPILRCMMVLPGFDVSEFRRQSALMVLWGCLLLAGSGFNRRFSMVSIAQVPSLPPDDWLSPGQLLRMPRTHWRRGFSGICSSGGGDAEQICLGESSVVESFDWAKRAAACGGANMAASGRKWPQVAASGSRASGRKWPQVVRSPAFTPQVVASGRKCCNYQFGLLQPFKLECGMLKLLAGARSHPQPLAASCALSLEGTREMEGPPERNGKVETKGKRMGQKS
eukprot:s1293_g13.t1